MPNASNELDDSDTRDGMQLTPSIEGTRLFKTMHFRSFASMQRKTLFPTLLRSSVAPTTTNKGRLKYDFNRSDLNEIGRCADAK